MMNIYILKLQKLWCLFLRSRLCCLLKLPNVSAVTHGVRKMVSLNELCCKSYTVLVIQNYLYIGRIPGLEIGITFLFDIFLIKISAKLRVEDH